MRENETKFKIFFRLAKMKARLRAPIGPFTDDKGKLIDEDPCETLNS